MAIVVVVLMLLTVINTKQSSCVSGSLSFKATPPSLRSGASFGLSLSGCREMPLLRYPVITFDRPSFGNSSTYCRKLDIGRLSKSCALSACEAMTPRSDGPEFQLAMQDSYVCFNVLENEGNRTAWVKSSNAAQLRPKMVDVVVCSFRRAERYLPR
jgi:hypothetical protein